MVMAMVVAMRMAVMRLVAMVMVVVVIVAAIVIVIVPMPMPMPVLVAMVMSMVVVSVAMGMAVVVAMIRVLRRMVGGIDGRKRHLVEEGERRGRHSDRVGERFDARRGHAIPDERHGFEQPGCADARRGAFRRVG